MYTEAIRRQKGLPETKGFKDLMSFIGRNPVTIVGGVIVSTAGIAVTAIWWAPIAASLAAGWALTEAAILGGAVVANCVAPATTIISVAINENKKKKENKKN